MTNDTPRTEPPPPDEGGAGGSRADLAELRLLLAAINLDWAVPEELAERALDTLADLLKTAKSPQVKIARVKLLAYMRTSDRCLLETLVKVRIADAEWEKHCRDEEFLRAFRLAMSDRRDEKAG
jgi:hypothetical protein